MQSIQIVDEETMLFDLEHIISRFEGSLPSRVDAAAMTWKSKVPFKMLSLKELLFHRITLLARTSLDLYVQGTWVPAYIVMRSTVETAALFFEFCNKVSLFLQDADEKKIDIFLMKCITGGKDEKSKLPPIHVLDCIRSIDKEYDGFLRMYEVLCEYTHPNFLGTLASFGKVDHANIWLDLGAEIKKPPPPFGLAPFLMAVTIFEDHYNSIAEKFIEVNDYFEVKEKG